jgi:hypothetical protein
MAAEEVPATSLVLAGEAWLAKADADLGAAEARLNAQLAARRQLRSRLEHVKPLAGSLDRDADTLIALAATDADVVDQTSDGTRSAPVLIADDDDDPVACLANPLGRLKLERVDLATLDNDGWLNDSVIMAFLYRLIEGRPEWAVIDSVLSADVTCSGWTKVAERLRPRSVAHLLLPMHAPDHWRLVVVDRAAATIRGYDSLPSDGIQTTLTFVRDVVVRGKLGWANEAWPTRRVAAPLQQDGHNCGPFILWWAKQLVETPDATLSSPAAGWRATIKSALESNTQGLDNVGGREGGAGGREKKRKRKER